jgi:DNA-binding CsgD family transcriptional regulator
MGARSGCRPATAAPFAGTGYVSRGARAALAPPDKRLAAVAVALLRELGRREAPSWAPNDRASNGWTPSDADGAPRSQGGRTPAEALNEECLRLFHDLGMLEGSAWAQHNLGQMALQRGDAPRAAALLAESLRLFQRCGSAEGIAACLSALEYLGAQAALAAVEAEPAPPRALPLPPRAAAPSVHTPADGPGWAAGPAAPAAGGRAKGPYRVLTPRELDVLRLVAEGLSNRQIARRLVVETRTVESHLTHIGSKLCLPRRAIVAHAAEMVRAAAAG